LRSCLYVIPNLSSIKAFLYPLSFISSSIRLALRNLEEKGFMYRIFNHLIIDKRLTFKIAVPNDLYLRAETLCDDVLQLRIKDKEYT
jgi:hypothetical protein